MKKFRKNYFAQVFLNKFHPRQRKDALYNETNGREIKFPDTEKYLLARSGVQDPQRSLFVNSSGKIALSSKTKKSTKLS